VAAATAYNVATGKVAVASVTCGPGVTQVMTALPAAVRARLPLVVFAGESPINAKFYNQHIDQAPLVTATGAHYIAAHSVPRMMDYVREAFHIAKYEQRPAGGLFHDHPFGLGTTGSYFTSLGREMYESADVVLAVGTSLSYYVGGGHYFTKACKIQLDNAPRGLRDGQKAADIYVRSDALIGIEAILAGLDQTLGGGQPTAAAIRTKELAHRIATEPADSMPFDIAPGVLDPREAI